MNLLRFGTPVLFLLVFGMNKIQKSIETILLSTTIQILSLENFLCSALWQTVNVHTNKKYRINSCSTIFVFLYRSSIFYIQCVYKCGIRYALVNAIKI